MNIKLKTNEQLNATVTNGLAGVFVNGVSLSASLSSKADLTALQNYYIKSETSSANEISTALENAGSKVYFDNRISGVTGRNDLSVVRLAAAEYAQMLEDGECLSNAIYIVDAPNIDAFKQQIKNVAPPTDLSDAVNKEYVDSNFQPAGSYLTAHQPISAAYANQHIRLSANNMLVGNIDCSDFVKDGMLSAVELCSDQLIFIFNAESGKTAISVALSNFIDETNYYAKSETSSATQISSALGSYLPLSGGNMAGALSVHYGDAVGAKAPCVVIDAYEKDNPSGGATGRAYVGVIGDIDAAPNLNITRYGDDGSVYGYLDIQERGITVGSHNNYRDWGWPYADSLIDSDPDADMAIANNSDIRQYCAFKNELGYALSTATGVLSSGSYVYDVADRTMTTIGINQSTTPVIVRLPAAGGRARDFILRIEISSETAPTFTFTNTAGLDFESEDDDWAVMQPGVNLISFTETKR